MNEKNKFEEYLLSEYSNIAQAHFKSIETKKYTFACIRSCEEELQNRGSGSKQTGRIFRGVRLWVNITLTF